MYMIFFSDGVAPKRRGAGGNLPSYPFSTRLLVYRGSVCGMALCSAQSCTVLYTSPSPISM